MGAGRRQWRLQRPGWGLLPPRSAAEVTFFPLRCCWISLGVGSLSSRFQRQRNRSSSCRTKAAFSSGRRLRAGPGRRVATAAPARLGVDTGRGLPGGGASLCPHLPPPRALADVTPLPGSNPRVPHRKGLLPAGSSATPRRKCLPPSLGPEKALTHVSPLWILACPQQSPRCPLSP